VDNDYIVDDVVEVDIVVDVLYVYMVDV